MNFELNNSYINKYKAFDKNKTNQMQNKHQNSLNFTGRGKELVLAQEFIKSFDKGADGIIESIDRALGKTQDGTTGYFSKLINDAGVKDLNIPKYKITEGLTESINGIFDLFNTLSYKLTKHYISESRATKKAQYIAMDQAREILQVFERCQQEEMSFNSKAAAEIATLAKNYQTKDERTINKIATSIVSTWFSANDFYNISMLQKDDDKEADKTRKARRKQELTRMGISAGLTYLTLGSFEKIVRNYSLGTPLMVALSTLTAEIFSRLLNKVKLTPLTPKKAEKIAKKNKAKAEKNNSSTQQNTTSNTESEKNLSKASSNTNNDNRIYQNIFKNSTQGSAYNLLFKNIANEKNTESSDKDIEKKTSFKKKLMILFAACNAIFWIGQIKIGKDHKKLNEIAEYIHELLTKTKVDIDTKKIDEYIISMQLNKKGKEIESLLVEFDGFIDSYRDCNKIHWKQDRAIASGIINGVLKIPKTIYQIMKIPSSAIMHFISKENKPDDGITKAISDKEKKRALLTLNSIIEKNERKSGVGTNETIANIVEDVKKNTRNINVKTAETGELANTSRTIVTGITTYFFVNDYRNKVLLESEGKDVKGANAEIGERCAHKAANFAINGTLMNLGNSVFKGPLNASLGFAAILPFFTEILNESLIRKFICQPIGKMESRDAIIDYETKKLQSKGIGGAWSRRFKKWTGKKSLTEKTGIQTQQKQT